MMSQRRTSRFPRRASPSPSGYTLVEVMIALAVFALSIIGAFSLLTLQDRMVRKTQDRLYVAQILESRLEELRDFSWADLNSLGAGTTFAVAPAAQISPLYPINPDDTGTTFTRTLTDLEHPPVGTITIADINANLKQVTVKVTWNSGHADQSVYMRLVSYFSSAGK